MKTLLMSFAAVMFLLPTDSFGQKPTKTTVCGDPSAACSKRAAFRDEDIPFEFNQGSVVAETAPFYIVIVKSAKIAQDSDCEKTPTDFDRYELQYGFLRNKVFVARGCYSVTNNYYTKLGTNIIAIAIFAGTTKAQADAFLKKVRSGNIFGAKDAYLLRTTTGFNGT